MWYDNYQIWSYGNYVKYIRRYIVHEFRGPVPYAMPTGSIYPWARHIVMVGSLYEHTHVYITWCSEWEVYKLMSILKIIKGVEYRIYQTYSWAHHMV